MESGTGITLFDPGDLKLNMKSHQEEDEEAIEDQKRREELLKAQLANAFDDWSDDDDGHDEDRGNSSCSSQEERSRHHANGMIFHSLSDISEHSPNKTGCHSSDVSKVNESGNSSSQGRKLFSPSRSLPNKFVQVNSRTPDNVTAMGGRGDADSNHYQPIFQNNSNPGTNEKFQPIFTASTSDDKSESFKNETAEAYRQAEYNSMEQLRVLYDVRIHEIQRLTGQLETERRETANHRKEMFKKLSLMEAEKERAVLSRTEANKLLVASKEEIGKLQKEVHTLKQTVAALEKDKSKSDEVAELSKLQLQELEQRISLMERCDSNKNFIKQTDIMIKDLKNKHQQEIQLLQRQLDTLNKKLSKKEEECDNLEKKVTELQRAHELLLVEKSETINQLAHRLEESQAQCHKLMAANVSVDSVRLQTQLEDALREKEQLNQTVRTLQAECGMLRSDMAQYETVSKLTLPPSGSSSDETDSIIQLGMSSRPQHSKRANINVSDMSTKLRDELHRALLSQKSKRAEICRLQEIVKSKEAEIQEMKSQERIYLAQTEGLNDQLNKMMAELSLLHKTKNEKEDSTDKAEEIAKLNAEVAELRKEKAVLEREKLETQRKLDDLTKCFEAEKRKDISDFNKEYLKFHDETVAKVRKEAEHEAELKIKEYSIRLEQSLKEVSEVKELYVSVCAAKEQMAHSLSLAEAELQQVAAERDRLTTELQENNALRDQLARRLNESAGSKLEINSQTTQLQQLGEERDQLRAELDKCIEMRDQLARRVNSFKRENDELAAEVLRLKTEALNNLPHETDKQLEAECTRLKEELSAMSTRHTQELSAVRTELQSARDRVIQLDKCARLQFEVEIKSLRQDRDMLKTKCDEKEVQIKKLIDSRKRPPAMVSVATETDTRVEVLESVMEAQRLEERHRRELVRCREEYNNMLSVMEQAHQEALASARNKSKEDIERLQDKHQQILEAVRDQLDQQEAAMKAAHREELLAVEEQTKQLTVKFFAEKVKELEAKYIEEASRRPDPTIVESLQKTLMEKTREVENLKQRLAALSEEHRQQVAALHRQMDADKDSVSQLMVQWAQEVKDMQGELKLKEAMIDDQRARLEKAQLSAKKNHNKLLKTNREITSQYMSKCAEYKAKMQEVIEEDEKKVFEKIKQLEQLYEDREKELRKRLSKKQHIT